MKFKKLSLAGFKSFANKLDIKFGEGITAIVGPNGCGKSNVADAVRWVLGEQSAKLLRGSSMSDVIFNGTKKRGALSYAEVSLTFDNKNKSLFPSYDYEEVVITRKLFRSGESEYYINGTLCRLRNITEMMRDAGFAREGYTIIGQGRVTELISSKPEDRRAIFEEAAGISKYKFKKVEAERRIERVRTNLTQINMLIDEDCKRLEPLSRQAEKARQYNDLKEKLKYHEINSYINRYETAAETKDKLNAAIDDFEKQIKAKQAEYDEASAAHVAAMEEAQSIEKNLEAYRAELMNLSVDKEKIAGQVELLTQQIRNITGQNEALISANATLGDNYNTLTQDADRLQVELREKTEAHQALLEDYEKLNAKYIAAADRVSEEERKIESARRALLDAMERKASVRQSMGSLTAERAALSDRCDIIRGRIEQSEIRIDMSREKESELSQSLQTLSDEKSALISEKEQKTAAYGECTDRLKVVADELAEVKENYSHDSYRKKILEGLKSSMEGYDLSVRKLREDAKTDEVIRSAMCDIVGEVMSIKEGFETAIDTVLGAAKNHIITKNENDARRLIEYLKVKKYGRATFLPLTSYKPRSLPDNLMSKLNRAGCFGVATGVVDYDRRYENIISGLLGNTVIVDNIDTAIALAKDCNYAFRIVTLDGDLALPQGSLVGGSKKSDDSNVFAREREIKEVVARVDELKIKLGVLQSEYDKLSAKSSELSKRIKEITEDVHEYEVIEAAQSIEHSKLVDELSASEREHAADVEMLDKLSARIAEITSDIDVVEKTQDELGTDRRTEEDDRSQRECENLRIARDALRDRVSDANLKIVTLGKDVDTLKAEIARLKNEAVLAAQSIENNNMSILGNNRTLQELNDRLGAMSESEGAGHSKRIGELNAKLSDLTNYRADLNRKAADTDNARMECSDEVSRLTEKKHEQEILLARVDSDMEAMQQRVSEAYGFGYEECLQYKDENYDAESGEIEIFKLRRRISNLGNINENAIEEVQELSKTYTERVTQRDDLVKSIADEERVLKEISDTMLKDFNECFEKIRVNFREVFREMFNGGTADLVLTDNEDPLARGVEINAQPPSKNLQSISLLSGGEKTLTAIAILFAILQLRPMPFCLLDEIEAALDDANVGRFASYLKKYSQDTQFIVITHRKPTMEQADCLYGVTMEEVGVTTIVSVRLSEASKYAMPADA